MRVGVAVASMVSSSRLRLIWRHFVNSRMGSMANKSQMPSPQTALPGRDEALVVSGKMRLAVCMLTLGAGAERGAGYATQLGDG